MKGIRDSNYNDEFTLELYYFDENKQVIKVKYHGCYLIVNNNYLDWSVTIPLIKLLTYIALCDFPIG